MNQTLLCIALLTSLSVAGCLNADPAAGGEGSLQLPASAQTANDEQRRANTVAPGALDFAVFDEAVTNSMATSNQTAAVASIYRNGELVYENAYGFQDEQLTQPMPADAMFRGASFAKPMMAAVIDIMVREGELNWGDPAVCVQPAPVANCRLEMQPHASRPVTDSRLAEISLADLRDHETGWTREQCATPDLQTVEIADAFDIPAPTPYTELVRWMLGEPLTYAPGAPTEDYDGYCNIAYVMLAVIAEQLTGASLEEIFRVYLWEPLDVVGEVEFGRTLPADRNPREPYYHCGGMGRSVYPPHDQVCMADGGLSVENLWPAGGVIASAAAYGAFFAAYDVQGAPRAEQTAPVEGKNGDFPGMTGTMVSYRLPSGTLVQVVLAFNAAYGPAPAPVAITGHKQDPALAFIALGAVEAWAAAQNGAAAAPEP